MNKPLEMYKTGSTISVEVKSIPEFKKLLEQAEKEACQLHETLNKLRCFTIDVKFGVEEEKPTSSQ
jgi:hypothetical protein